MDQLASVARATTPTTDLSPTIMMNTQRSQTFKIGLFGRPYFADLHTSLGTCVTPE